LFNNRRGILADGFVIINEMVVAAVKSYLYTRLNYYY